MRSGVVAGINKRQMSDKTRTLHKVACTVFQLILYILRYSDNNTVSCIVVVPIPALSTHPDFKRLLVFIRNLICLVDPLTLQAVTVMLLRGDPEQHLASPVTPGVPTSPTCSLITPYRLVVLLLSKLR